MIVSQTDYIDFLSKSGTPKVTKVKEILNRPPYHPALDFYKPLRDELIEHRTKEYLLEYLEHYKGTKKYHRFKALIEGYSKFLGRKQVTFLKPQTRSWNYKDLSVRVNPELALELNGSKYLVKLYFKEEPLSNQDVKVAQWMMNQTLSIRDFSKYRCALLDLERGKLHYKFSSSSNQVYDALLTSEAEGFLKIWDKLQGR